MNDDTIYELVPQAEYQELLKRVPQSTYDKMVEESASWKEAWYQQRLATGRGMSYEYYRGLLLGMRQAQSWTTAMYQIAGRVAVHLSSIRKEGPGLSKLYGDRPMVPQLNPKHKANVLNEISKLLK